MQEGAQDAPRERIPREQRPDAIARMMNARACRLDSDEDRWHVLCAALSTATWRGIPILKNHFDMRRYFEILRSRRPEVIVETGLQYGASAAFFMDCCRMIGLPQTVYIGIDLSLAGVPDFVIEDPHPHGWIQRDCLAPETVAQVAAWVGGKRALFVLDSVHSEAHVTEELRLYAPIVPPESHLVVEDTDHSGHPVLADYGPSAWHAVEAFMAEGGLGHRLGFEYDVAIESLYGPFTNSPRGWLRRGI